VVTYRKKKRRAFVVLKEDAQPADVLRAAFQVCATCSKAITLNVLSKRTSLLSVDQALHYTFYSKMFRKRLPYIVPL
jgi:hypothetical protein